MIAFIVVTAVVFVLLALLSGYSSHMGNPEPTDWTTIAVVSLLLGLVGLGLWMGFIEATAVVSGVLS